MGAFLMFASGVKAQASDDQALIRKIRQHLIVLYEINLLQKDGTTYPHYNEKGGFAQYCGDIQNWVTNHQHYNRPIEIRFTGKFVDKAYGTKDLPLVEKRTLTGQETPDELEKMIHDALDNIAEKSLPVIKQDRAVMDLLMSNNRQPTACDLV